MRDIRIDRENNVVVMTRKFAAKADDPRTEEFRLLQEVKAAYPNIKVKNHTIKKNPNKECYRGLTYDYMRKYIRIHESKENVESALAELEDLIFTSKGHSKGYRYPTIKAWFLERYSDFATFGVDEKKLKEKAIEEYKPIVTKIFEDKANLKPETEAA